MTHLDRSDVVVLDPELASSGLPLAASFFHDVSEGPATGFTLGALAPFNLLYAESASIRATKGPSRADLQFDLETQTTVVMGEDDPTSTTTQCYECSQPSCCVYDHIPDDSNTDAG